MLPAPVSHPFGRVTSRLFSGECRHFLGSAFLVLLLASCTTVGNQINPTTLQQNLSLQPGALQQDGIAFLTPSTVTGQEQDRQALALYFAEQMRARLPSVRVISLPETLGAINRASLAADYRRMVEDYRETGIFPHEILANVGRASGTRYLIQLKLAAFGQDMRERISVLGLRLFQTLHANIRLYVQIWDAQTATIAWEGSVELSYAYDSSKEVPVTFRRVVEEAARQILQQLP